MNISKFPFLSEIKAIREPSGEQLEPMSLAGLLLRLFSLEPSTITEYISWLLSRFDMNAIYSPLPPQPHSNNNAESINDNDDILITIICISNNT